MAGPKVGDVWVGVKVADRELSAAMGKIKGFTSQLQVAMAGAAAIMGSSLVQGIVDFEKRIINLGKEALEAWSRQKEAQDQLAQALQNVGMYSQETFEYLKDVASQIQAASTYGDEELLPVMTQLARTGKLTKEQLAEATRVVADMAAATGRDLRSATLAVQYALEGNVGMLRRWGVMVDENKFKVASLEERVRMIGEAFKGAAEIAAQTWTGKMKQIENLAGDLKEKVGMWLETFAAGFGDLLGEIKQFLESLNTALDEKHLYGAIRYLATIQVALKNVGRAVYNAFIRPLEIVLGLLGQIVRALVSIARRDFKGALQEIKKIPEVYWEGIEKWWQTWDEVFNPEKIRKEIGETAKRMADALKGIKGLKVSVTGKVTKVEVPEEKLKVKVPMEITKVKLSLEGVEAIRRMGEDWARALEPFFRGDWARGITSALERAYSQWHKGISEWFERLLAARGVTPFWATFAGGFLPTLGLVGVETILERIFNPDRFKTQINFKQEININIGEGEIAERAFWDDLVQYYILPSIQRGGLAPMPQGGRG